MNAQMRLVIMLTSVAVSGSILFAAEENPPARKAPPAQAQTQTVQGAQPQKPEAEAAGQKSPQVSESKTQAEQKAEAPDAKAQDPEPKRAASSADKAGSPQRFNPSEQVRADFDVSFPIDI